MEGLRGHGLTAVVVVAAFHRQRVLPLMARRRRLFEMRPDEGIRISASALSDEEILRQVRETVEAKLRSSGLNPFTMRPSRGFLSLGMRDVRDSPLPIPEDARRWAVNRAHAEVQKRWKDAEVAKRMRKILAREELEKRRRQQKLDGLPVEASPSPSLSEDSLDEDDESERGRGPLDHLPNVGETAPRALASGPALPGGGGGATLGPTIARPGAEADTPEARALGKRAVSPMGSTAVGEQAVARATQLPSQRIEGAPGSIEDRPTPADAEAVPLPPPPPSQRRVTVLKRLQPRSSRKWPTEVSTLAPFKALKVSPSSITHLVAEAQAAIQRGTASARADPKEPAAQGGAAEATPTQMGEGAPPPREDEAHGSDGAEAPSLAEATKVKAPRASEAGASRTAEATTAGAGAPGTTEAMMAEAGAPEATEATMVETGAPEATEADVIAVKPSA
ncbi:uncharacterized protein [Miscanthus floridulus]|uniref:uncharacterized protein n=1 Tax=Miscanthus floridulus TaxID=154761 RepID=UPI003458ED3C